MDERVIICETHIWTETDLESYVRITMSIDKLEPFSGDGYQSKPDFEFLNI